MPRSWRRSDPPPSWPSPPAAVAEGVLESAFALDTAARRTLTGGIGR